MVFSEVRATQNIILLIELIPELVEGRDILRKTFESAPEVPYVSSSYSTSVKNIRSLGVCKSNSPLKMQLILTKFHFVKFQ